MVEFAIHDVLLMHNKGSTWVKTKCDMATLKVVASDVSLDKNCRKWRPNLIKVVESTLKFIEDEDRHEWLIKSNYSTCINTYIKYIIKSDVTK